MAREKASTKNGPVITGELILFEPKKHSVRYNAADGATDPALDSAYISKIALANAGVDTANPPKRLRYTIEVIQ